jgi:hypothetical protein
MNHIDPDTLALIAMSELEPDEAERMHLAACAHCTTELAELTRTVSIGRTARTDELQSPSPEVWQRISAELGLGASTGAAPVRVQPVELDVDDRPPADLDTARRRRRGSRIWIPLVAAAVVIGLIGGLTVGVWVGSSPSAPTAAVVARARLDAFPGWPGARGDAVVEQLPDGSREVLVEVDAAAAEAPLREVWLIAADASGLVSIGFLTGRSGRFVVPAGIDLAAYPLVDVSNEADDGDPAHSGDSIVRGELRGTVS